MFKRVISNPDEVGKGDGKISKTSVNDRRSVANNAGDENGGQLFGGWPVALEKNLAGKNAEANPSSAPTSHQQTTVTPHPSPVVVPPDDTEEEPISNAPVSSITNPISSGCSTASSGLSDRSNGSPARLGRETATAAVPNTGSGIPPTADGDVVMGDVVHNTNENIGTSGLLYRTESRESKASSESSSSSVTRSTNDGTGSAPSSSGAWGWFDDVHGHDHADGAGVGVSGTDLKKLQYGPKEDRDHHDYGGKQRKKGSKKKGGLFNLIPPTMTTTADIALSPPKEDTSAMAVTAPTYVLEESLSSQKLWKDTAGMRPPQPVEERAFYEKMWAQNFRRSQVRYELPVEVLTASSPISLSPFADGNFGDDGAGAPGSELSNYNLPANFNTTGAKRIGAGDSGGIDAAADPATVKKTEADAAEAALIHRMSGAAWGFYDSRRPKDYDLKKLGPHHHHHTLVNKKVKGTGSDGDLTVLVRGDNVFGTTVSKSFPREGDNNSPMGGVDTVSISVASYRVVESRKRGKYAQFLVIYCEGSFRDTVGVWKRYSDFDKLSRKVMHGHESCSSVLAGVHPLSVTEDTEVELLPNAITSWRLLKKRQRWYRCLDAGYLSLKVFLLERFLHDILFESSSPQLLRDFIGVNSKGH